MVPPEKYEGNLMEQGTAIEPFVRYQVHLVRLVGRDVVGYARTVSGLMGGWGTEYPQLIHLRMNPHPDYPVFGRGTPPERTLRVGVLYRVTNLLDWRPHPSHPYGEDEWHLVWSDVRLGSRCETLGVGFHTFDREMSARLDEYFGLAAVLYTPLEQQRFPYRPTPILSRLSREGFFEVQPGEVKLPEWATPPGW
ncbi:hypothetical protein [Thermus sp.]|uniref:hypothetical protein n=1 Tax=Thermus sp. TaxID=275 RepID=UPI00298F0363|nr:hypothetical protein [Thermus sp.]MDW8358603.1 hypothetical protein [Thermus sp.]